MLHTQHVSADRAASLTDSAVKLHQAVLKDELVQIAEAEHLCAVLDSLIDSLILNITTSRLRRGGAEPRYLARSIVAVTGVHPNRVDLLLEVDDPLVVHAVVAHDAGQPVREEGHPRGGAADVQSTCGVKINK